MTDQLSALDLGDANADLTSHDTFTAGVPHATFKRLRDTEPVCWIDEKDGSGFWAVTKYQDIIEVSRNVEVFTSREGIRLEEMTPEETEARRTLMEQDPPEHTRLRRLVSRGFTRRTVETYEDQIRELAVEVVNDAVRLGEFDFVDTVARALPMKMLGRLVGTPDEDGNFLVELGDALIGNSDPEFTDHVVDMVDTDEFRMLPFRSPAGVKLFKYAGEQAQLRRENPQDDIITKLLANTTDGEPLTEHEFNNFFTLLVAAGNDTTRYTVTGAMKLLLEQPELIEYLRHATPEQWDLAADELIRATSVTMNFRRTATRDTVLGGKQIAKGDKVVIFFVSGNFDEERFENPYELNLQRESNDHMSFGRGGPHFCLGAWLARMELRDLPGAAEADRYV
ncbi:MAG: cytochrome P450 [Acidimicrobiales bacterium]